MKTVRKGEYGYISYRRKITIVRTVICFALCAAVFLAGFITTGTRRNLLTIVAVLGCLPAARSMVNAIMFVRAKGCSAKAHELIVEALASGERPMGTMAEGYDLYLTSYRNNYPLSHAVVYRGMVTALCEDDTVDVRAGEKHIEDHLKADGISGLNIKIYTDTGKYIARLKQLAELEDAESKTHPATVLDTLKAVSL